MNTSLQQTGWLLAFFGFALSVMTSTAAQPIITGIPEQDIPVNTSTAKLPFNVGDAETPASALVVTASSDAPALVGTITLEIVAGGGGAARTIRIVPVTDAVGSAHITVTVTDGDGEMRSTTFLLNVMGPPIILTPPSSLTVYADDPASFTVVAPGTGLLFSWLKNGLNFGGPVGVFATHFTIARAHFSDAGDYVAVVTSLFTGLSVTSSPAAHLTVLPGVGLSVTVAGSGAAFSTPSRITCPGPAPLQTAKFPPGSSVTLTATPAVGWAIGRWWVDGVQQPGTGADLMVTMDTPHAVGAVFNPMAGAGGYSFIAISGGTPGGPVSGGVYFDSVSSPQISDLGRVLFSGNLISTDTNHPVLPQERTGLWYSRTRISAHLDNAIIRQVYSYLWYTPPFYPAALREMRAVYDFNGTPFASFTSDGDIALSPRMQISVADIRTAALVYEPYAEYNPTPGPGIPIPPPPPPQFQTVANPDQRPVISPQDPNKRWLAVGGAVFQGDAPSAVPVTSGGSRVAFSGSYVTYDIVVDPITLITNSYPVATNSGLFSGTRLGGIDLVIPVSSVGPGFRSEGGVLGSGLGALASIATYSGGSGAGDMVVWTSDGGIVASVGSAPPNLAAGYPENTKINTVLNLHLSKLGAVGFLAGLTGTGLSANSNTVVYLRRHGQAPVPVVRGGELIAGAPAPANLFLVAAQDTLSVADNASGDLAIGTHLCCAGGANVVIRHDASGNHLAFIDGTPMPAFGPNKKLYLQRIGGAPAFWHPPTINAQGRIAFFGIVAESTALEINQYSRGVWLLEPDGSLRQLLVEGQILPEFGRVEVIAEPRGNRWFNNNGEVAVQILQTIQTTPTTINKTAILKISTGPAILPVVSATPGPSPATILLRWPASFPDAIIETRSGLDAGGTSWSPISPVLRRIGANLEAEISPAGDMGFFRLIFPAPETP